MINAQLDTATGVRLIDQQPHVFHCNHYNRSLQQTIENCRHIDNKAILLHSAAEVAYLGLSYHFKQHADLSLLDKVLYAEALYSFCGFGKLPLYQALQQASGSSQFNFSTAFSHYGRALTLNFEKRKGAGEYFDLGFTIGALSAIFEKPFSGQLTTEAISLQHAHTTFQIDYNRHKTFAYLFNLTVPDTLTGSAPGLTASADENKFATNIDEVTIQQAVSQAPLYGNQQGLIPAFGVELTQHYADYYNLISFRFEQQLTQALKERPILRDLLVYDYPALFYYKQYVQVEGLSLSRTLLIEAGHICGFNTLGGIMRSETWDALVLPMIKTREDWLFGILAIINTLGWGIWRIHDLIPGEKLVLRVWQPYESLGYLKWLGYSDHPIDYLVTGVTAALMNLLYEGDITAAPPLTLEYYYQINRSPISFWATQSRCVAMGDAYSEVTATRRQRG